MLVVLAPLLRARPTGGRADDLFWRNEDPLAIALPRPDNRVLLIGPRYLEGYPCLHLTTGRTERVRGPLALGAGTGYGIGLFVPVGEEFLGRGRGGVEGS